MAMKTKTLGFIADSNMFVGANYDSDEEGNLGIVTFQDDSEFTAKAYELTEQALKDDKGLKLLEEICKTELGCQNHLLYKRAHKAKTEIWTILWHKFLIEALEANGWNVHPMYSIDFIDYDLSKNAMVI